MFEIWLQVLKYGFSTILILAGIVLLVLAWREGRSLKSFLSGLSIVAYPLIGGGVILAIFTGDSSSNFSLFLVKAISTAFGLIYGIYATLNGFIETDKDTGKRTVTRLGIVGIFLLSFNTVLSMTMDYLQEAAALETKLKEKEEALALEKERKLEYEKLLGSVGFVGQRAGDLKIDFEKFSQSLYTSLISVETDLKKTRADLAAREAELKDTILRMAAAEANVRELQDTRSRLEKTLGGTEADLRNSRERAEQADAARKTAQESLSRKEQELAGLSARLKETEEDLAARSSELQRVQEQAAASSRQSAAAEAELRELKTRAAGLDASLRQSQEEARKTAASLASRETEVKLLQAQTQKLEQQTAQLQQQNQQLQQQKDQLQIQLQQQKPPAEVQSFLHRIKPVELGSVRKKVLLGLLPAAERINAG